MTDLVFRIPTGGTDLVFGKSGTIEGDVYRVSVSGVFPPITATIRVAIAYGSRVQAVLPDVTAHTVASYRSEVSRPVVGTAKDSAGAGPQRARHRADSAMAASPRQSATRGLYGVTVGRQSGTAGGWVDAGRTAVRLVTAFEDAQRASEELGSGYQHGAAAHRAFGGRFDEGEPTASRTASQYQDAMRHARISRTSGFQLAIAARGSMFDSAAPAIAARRGCASPFQDAMRPGRGKSRPPAVEPEQPPSYIPNPHLLFWDRIAKNAHLVFGRPRAAPGSQIIIPTLRVYIVINSASLTRVSNNLPLPVTSLSIAIDADSAHWTWSATLPLRALADLEPDAPGEPIELEAVVNGHAWRLLVERLAESERFGQASLQIGGRGIAAELSDPNYPVVSHGNPDAAAMAQQLAAASLTINGVPLGWAVDWTAADWLIPAGAWVHRGTPLDAVARIAAAAGAYVQAAPASRSLRIRPRYPVAPWDWASAVPDVVLPAAAVMERGTEHTTRPAYDSVYVSGEAGGVLARVKRAGFAGNTPAPMVVDALVTHTDAARGRGLEVLGNTGAQRIMTLETGILPASGVIHVGSLLDWTRGPQVARGLVRSLAVSATAPSGASADPVKVRQTVRVEVHD